MREWWDLLEGSIEAVSALFISCPYDSKLEKASQTLLVLLWEEYRKVAKK